MRIIAVALLGATITGCASLMENASSPSPTETSEPIATPVVQEKEFCLVSDKHDDIQNNCDLGHWINLWVEADRTAWPARKAKMADLSSSFEDTLHKVLLSMPTDTPYQDRLRAQRLLKDLTPLLTPEATLVVSTMLSKPNEQLLEFESAISLLSRVNTRQTSTIDNLKAELKAQQDKVEELLQIEASLMDKNRSNQQ
ncbi:hypothetical protein [Alteromonas halophila]|uniref:YfhG lipoprotein n=1 Tax=Alteromonas halophila TaxID=516698 RepID=A0A918JD66_9ALTE|nr:hypothetical protein [Alteromonas halophila]GGW74810.1 hypothetical protein GCM10007391_03640 [Alteromonas halophila]